MSRLVESVVSFASSRAPPPPVPVVTSPQVVPDSVSPPTEKKKKKPHRGLIRAVGVFFKRKCSEGDATVRPPVVSDASPNRMVQWIHGSQRQSMPDMPLEAVEPLLYQERETLTSVCPLMEETPVPVNNKRVKQETKADKGERRKVEAKANASFVKAKPSPTDSPELLRAESSSGNESNVDPLRVSFLIFGGSEVDSTFEPELHPSEFDDVHGSEIRPVLQNKMPLFFSLPLAERLRRSSAKSDPKEDELMQRKIEKSSEDGAETKEERSKEKERNAQRGDKKIRKGYMRMES
uniref:Uncharacterized protein n=1 Tax=Peronospora matthiolae TaxID=2874970 RepID=A0AAV1VG46_9STRA